jgi:hypothetical protein
MFVFLALPTELRFMVYHHVSDPVATCLSDYKGMYLSCRQIKAEMDQECPRPLSKYLEMEGGPEPGQLNLQLVPLPRQPHFRDIRNLRITFELGDWLANVNLTPFAHYIWRPHWVGTDDFFASNSPRFLNLGSLAPLKLESITFVVTFSADPSRYPGQIRETVEIMCREVIQTRALPNVKRFEFAQTAGWDNTLRDALGRVWRGLPTRKLLDWRFVPGYPVANNDRFICERITKS